MENCLCGSLNSYTLCCEKFISHSALPTTPEELMRSRYSAYSLKNIDYISNTIAGPASKGFDPVEAFKWAQQVTWIKLEVMKSFIDNHKGYVEFRAHLEIEQEKHILHELSEFMFINGQWFYTNGIIPKKISRNDNCPCGSGEKFKKCCI